MNSFKYVGLSALLAMTALIQSQPARADNIADCEIVLMETIEDESGQGSAKVASYRPADEFIASVYVEDLEPLREIDGLAIRGLLCRRGNIVVSDADFELLASGVPFVVSQNFDSAASDVVTYYFKDGAFRYAHKGPELDAQATADIQNRLDDFSAREHDLLKRESEKRAKEEEAATIDDTENTERKPIKVITLDDDETANDETLSDK